MLEHVGAKHDRTGVHKSRQLKRNYRNACHHGWGVGWRLGVGGLGGWGVGGFGGWGVGGGIGGLVGSCGWLRLADCLPREAISFSLLFLSGDC